MPNIATVLKDEITRLARKQARAETDAVRRATVRHRGEIAALKREVAALQKKVQTLSRAAPRARPAASEAEVDGEPPRRFSAKGLASHRRRLGLSAEAFGTLVGVTGQSIYKWETGKARPRASQMSAIAALRSLGKRQAQARLEELQQQRA